MWHTKTNKKIPFVRILLRQEIAGRAAITTKDSDLGETKRALAQKNSVAKPNNQKYVHHSRLSMVLIATEKEFEKFFKIHFRVQKIPETIKKEFPPGHSQGDLRIIIPRKKQNKPQLKEVDFNPGRKVKCKKTTQKYSPRQTPKNTES